MPDFSPINTFIFDVDGVFTDGSIVAFRTGEFARNFFIKDGYAVEKAIQSGYRILIISGGSEESVRKRLEFLGITEIFIAVKDKVQFFHDYTSDNHIEPSSILYMGDDIPDLKMLRLVGLPTCPNDAVEEIKDVCSYISPKNGGRGAVRDVIEKVMKAQNKWNFENW
jgi:3-deoxy-D-manno-octulosonate 8-phosphate phosphatase (KDO 8-P phosphatase)